MLRVAGSAARALGESAALVRHFLLRQQNPDGGFKGRAERSDLYYTVFGIDALIALQGQDPFLPTQSAPPADEGRLAAGPGAATALREPSEVSIRALAEALERARGFALSFGEGAELDFVHLCCLARAIGRAAGSSANATSGHGNPLSRHLESFRSRDGGYHPAAGSRNGTAYGCFLALAAYQDLGWPMPDPGGLVQCLTSLATPDGAWSNAASAGSHSSPKSALGSTNATAAAVAVLRHLRQPVPPAAARWLLARWHTQGGFLAAPDAPLPDLLSTATALHALAGMGIRFDSLRERGLDYLDSLWTNEGSFHAHWAEETLDCEYTFYGLLALGHLH
jgi:prenyltransferase beta subunit